MGYDTAEAQKLIARTFAYLAPTIELRDAARELLRVASTVNAPRGIEIAFDNEEHSLSIVHRHVNKGVFVWYSDKERQFFWNRGDAEGASVLEVPLWYDVFEKQWVSERADVVPEPGHMRPTQSPVAVLWQSILRIQVK